MFLKVFAANSSSNRATQTLTPSILLCWTSWHSISFGLVENLSAVDTSLQPTRTSFPPPWLHIMNYLFPLNGIIPPPAPTMVSNCFRSYWERARQVRWGWMAGCLGGFPGRNNTDKARKGGKKGGKTRFAEMKRKRQGSSDFNSG